MIDRIADAADGAQPGRMDGKKVLITGGAGGIGAAAARLMAAEGACVCITDLDAEGAQCVADEIRAVGNEAFALPLDVTDEESWASGLRQAAETAGGAAVFGGKIGNSSPPGSH